MGYKHDKKEIVRIGSELIRKKGYYQVGINEILKSCHIPKGSFYNFFESKEEFAIEAIKTYSEENVSMISDILLNDEGTALERLKKFYTKVVNHYEQDGFEGGCLINNLCNEIGAIEGTLQNVLDDAYSTWIGMIEKTIRQAQIEGDIRKDMKANELAEYIQNGLNGSLTRMKLTKNRKVLDQWVDLSFRFIRK